MLKTTQVNYETVTQATPQTVAGVTPVPVQKSDATAKPQKPSMRTAVADAVDTALGLETGGGWQWYHYAILIAVLALLSWGGWYLYKKFKG